MRYRNIAHVQTHPLPRGGTDRFQVSTRRL